MQWIIASLTNDPEQLARFAGMAKGVLAGGIACSFGTEAAELSQLRIVAYNFTIQAVGLLCMTYIGWTCVTATNYRLEKNVIPPAEMETPDKEGEEVELGINQDRT